MCGSRYACIGCMHIDEMFCGEGLLENRGRHVGFMIVELRGSLSLGQAFSRRYYRNSMIFSRSLPSTLF